MDREKNQKGLNVLNAIFGTWLIIAPFILGYLGSPRVNDIVVGIIVFVLALISAFYENKWSQTINLLVGIWLIISPFVSGYASITGAMVNDIILGLLVIIFSGAGLGFVSNVQHAHASDDWNKK